MRHTVTRLAMVLVIVGALNWGLVGLAKFDLVATLFGGSDAILSRIVYGLVGVAGAVLAVTRLAGRTVPTREPEVVGAR